MRLTFFSPLKLSATAEERADRSTLYRLMSVKDLQGQTKGQVSAGKSISKVTLLKLIFKKSKVGKGKQLLTGVVLRLLSLSKETRVR